MFPTYKDMTFCIAKECTNLNCHRHMLGPNFTPAPEDKYIALSDFRRSCKEYTTNTMEDNK